MIRTYFNALNSSPPSSFPAGLLTNLVAWWKLDETTSPCVNAKNPGTSDFTVAGTQTTGTGKFSNAQTGFGTATYNASASAGFACYNQDFSLQAWIKSTNVAVFQTIFRKCATNGANQDYSVYLNSATDVIVEMYNANVAETFTLSPTLSNNTWYHFVLTHNASAKRLRLYQNGTQVNGNHIYTYTIPGDFGSPIRLGNYTDSLGSPVLGSLDEVAFWTRELSGSDVTSLYNSGTGITY